MKMLDGIGRFFESRWFLPVLALCGTSVRLILIFIMQRLNTPGFADEVDYENIGSSVASGLGFIRYGAPTAFRAPAQPVFIALFFRVFGHSLLPIKVGQAILMAAIPYICARIGRSLKLSIFASNFGAAIAAFHPALIYAATTIYPSILTTFALTLGVWLSTIVIQRFKLILSVGAGLSLGIAGVATTSFAPLAVIIAFLFALKRSYKAAIIIGLLGATPVALWMIRNERQLGRFTVATNGGYNLYLGANDNATPLSGNWIDPHLSDEKNISELALDDEYKKLGSQWIKAHPTHWVQLALARSILVFDSNGNPRTQGLHSGMLAHAIGWLLLPVILMGLAGIVINYTNPLAWMTTAALLLVVVSSAATITKPRFRFPCDPLLSEFAVSTLVGVRSYMRRSKLGCW